MKSRQIDSSFKRKERDEENLTPMSEPTRVHENPRIEENVNRVCPNDIENSLECWKTSFNVGISSKSNG
ncbi:unnamed protein product [Lathyrus sativus]|nr:unnamed protein product [Lathyrus sativus]